MASETTPNPNIRSLSWQTDIDVLPPDHRLERRPGHWVIRSPSNPDHWWGNFLLFDEPPALGDAEAWEARFIEAFGPPCAHRAFAWDRLDGSEGATAQFTQRGYRLESTIGLIAEPAGILPHPRENREVAVRALNPARGADEELWQQVIELQMSTRDPHETEVSRRRYSEARQSDLRAMFAAGRGAWFVAVLGDERGGGAAEVVASCGVVVTGSRARYQAVDTAAGHRRRGICTRLVAEAARRTAAAHPVQHLVICADPGYFAIKIYESLGFSACERVVSLLRPPDGAT